MLELEETVAGAATLEATEGELRSKVVVGATPLDVGPGKEVKGEGEAAAKGVAQRMSLKPRQHTDSAALLVINLT